MRNGWIWRDCKMYYARLIATSLKYEHSTPLELIAYKAYKIHDYSRECDSVRETMPNTFRHLAQTQESLPTSKMSAILASYDGPPKFLELVLSEDFPLLTPNLLPPPPQSSNPVNDSVTYPPLATALRLYALAYLAEYNHVYPHTTEMPVSAELEQSKSLIRRLLRTRVDPHVQIHRPFTSCDELEVFTEYGTPLDEMFTHTNTPAESRAVADGWLQILRSEGYDISAYIEKEIELHCTRPQFTFPYIGLTKDIENPCELLFAIDEEDPGISWDWWIDPLSSTYLIRSTFTQMLMLSYPFSAYILPWWETCSAYVLPWEETWPFRFPPWHEHCSPDFLEDAERSIVWQQLHNAAQQRANRRLHKRHVKEMRSRGLKYPRMPGAWHD